MIARSPTRQIACTYTPLTVPTHLPNGWWFLIERPSTADGITADICFVLLIRTVCTLHTSTCLCQKNCTYCHPSSILWNQDKLVGRKLFRHMPDQRGTPRVRLTPTPRTNAESMPAFNLLIFHDFCALSWLNDVQSDQNHKNGKCCHILVRDRPAFIPAFILDGSHVTLNAFKSRQIKRITDSP